MQSKKRTCAPFPPKALSPASRATAHCVPPLRRLRLHPVSGPRKRRPADHSALILAPENSTTLLHFSTSLATNLLKSAGEPGSGVPPSSAIRAFVLGSSNAALSSLLSLSILAGNRPRSEPPGGAPNAPSSSPPALAPCRCV